MNYEKSNAVEALANSTGFVGGVGNCHSVTGVHESATQRHAARARRGKTVAAVRQRLDARARY